MKQFFLMLMIIFLTSCQFSAKISKPYEKYFTESSWNTFKRGTTELENENYKLADSLLSNVIENSNTFTRSTPVELNPYYFRGYGRLQLGKYREALEDLDHVVEDTTSNKDVMFARSVAFAQLKQYEKAIDLSSKLINMDYKTSAVLSQRGICYFETNQFTKACQDFTLLKKIEKGDLSYFKEYFSKCEL